MEQQDRQTNPSENNLKVSGSTPSPIAAALQRENSAWVSDLIEALNETTITIAREYIVDVCAFLKTAPDCKFNFLSDLCGFDRGPEEEPRFEVNYHLFSTTKHHRVRLKVLLNEDDPVVPSVTGIWRTANWHERETYDLFGV